MSQEGSHRQLLEHRSLFSEWAILYVAVASDDGEETQAAEVTPGAPVHAPETTPLGLPLPTADGQRSREREGESQGANVQFSGRHHCFIS